VMFDAAKLDYEDNVRLTREITDACHARGVWVEAELGEVGGKEASSAHAPGVRTDPDEAARFVAQTGVDALAVAVGSSHAMLSRDAALDFDLIARLRDAVPVPLVLHGSSGVGNESLAKAVEAGMTKINVSTHLNKVFTAAVREYLDAHPAVVDTRKYLGAGRDAMAGEVSALLRILAG
jgi:fructose-bisphosphate aldolase class II